MSAKVKASKVSRRKFLKGRRGCDRRGTAATVAFPQVSRAQTTTLKMQSSWGAKSVIFQDMAQASMPIVSKRYVRRPLES